MSIIITIAKNTFKETIRDRILYGIFAFALLFLISTVLFGSISLGEDIKVIRDFGLAGIYIFSIIITIFLGTSLIYKEIEKRTLYIIFSKPVSVTQFILGKFIGLMAGIKSTVILMTVTYLIIVYFKGGGIDWLALWSTLLLLFELAIFAALTILFSTFTTPLAGTIYAVIILYIGHSLGLVHKYGLKAGGILKYLSDMTYYLMPNLEKFNLRNSVVHGLVPNSGQIIYPIVYAIFYTAILLFLANISLKKQDL
jgi:ABC-type transport system involved in multi-copper enzyme maturation permease subunit